MPVVFLDCAYRPDLEQAIVSGLRAVGVSDADVRVCSNFETAVRTFLGVANTTDRPGGRAGGRTLLPPGGGEPVVFLDVAVVADPDYREGLSETQALERLTAHEACHVLLLRRGEDLTDVEIEGLAPVPGVLRQLAAIAVAEYRAEKTVRAAGYADTSNSGDRLIPIVVETHNALVDPASADPLALSQKMAPICQSYLVSLAISAAWDQHLGPPELVELIDQGGSTRLYDNLRTLPSADIAIAESSFRSLLDNLKPLIVGAVLDVGFEWVDRPQGQRGFFRRTSDDLLTRRAATAAVWYEEQLKLQGLS